MSSAHCSEIEDTDELEPDDHVIFIPNSGSGPAIERAQGGDDGGSSNEEREEVDLAAESSDDEDDGGSSGWGWEEENDGDDDDEKPAKRIKVGVAAKKPAAGRKTAAPKPTIEAFLSPADVPASRGGPAANGDSNGAGGGEEGGTPGSEAAGLTKVRAHTMLLIVGTTVGGALLTRTINLLGCSARVTR